jgi:two-component system NtrC family sensor kinase
MDVEVFFLVPIYLTTRTLGRTGGVIAAFGCATAAAGADIYNGQSSHSLIVYWNGSALLAFFSVVVILVDAVIRANVDLEAKVDQRTNELERANVELESAQFRLVLANQELEAKVDQRTNELDQANVELKSVQFRLIEAGRMESVGRIAAGIAHEVKNPLMTITMAADYLVQVIPKDDVEGSIMVQDMRLAVDRANRVISELMEFSRPAELSLQLEDFHAIAEHALGLMKFQLRRKHINVVRKFTEGALVLSLDKNKMEQVLVNLFMNAIQAMPDSGTLTVATWPLKTGGGLTVDIEDNGPGISDENLTKIKQPYFTTKSAGQGTGLGLAVCRNIVKLHGGTLTLGNRPEGGVRATIELNSQPTT